MLRDVPHIKPILAFGMGALVLGVVVLTWVYPHFCCQVSQVKAVKVREYMEDRYGIPDRSVNELTTSNRAEQIPKVVPGDQPPETAGIQDGEAAPETAALHEPEVLTKHDSANGALPPAKMR